MRRSFLSSFHRRPSRCSQRPLRLCGTPAIATANIVDRAFESPKTISTPNVSSSSTSSRNHDCTSCSCTTGTRFASTKAGTSSPRLPSPPSSSTSTDVLIVGGGVVGCAVAHQLARSLPAGNSALRVGLVEAGPGPPPYAAASSSAVVPHPRSYALSPASLEILGLTAEGGDHRIGDRLGWYDSMQVWESSQPSALVLTGQDADLDFLGAVVEDSALVQSLWDRTVHASTVSHVWTNTVVSNVQGLTPMSNVQVTLESKVDGSVSTHETRLVIAADGAHSSLRKMAGIRQSSAVDYEQTALTFTVDIDPPHVWGRCYQRFLPSGPLALLPTHSPRHAIVVWSTTPALVEEWKDHPDLVQFLNEQLQQGPGSLDPLFDPSPRSALHASLPAPVRSVLYGIDKLLETVPVAAAMASVEAHPFVAPPHIRGVASTPFAFPLGMRHADRYVVPRLALVGDAAHTVHPLAGQGLNLGLQDASSVVSAIVRAVQAGMDPASFLNEYEASRRAQVEVSLQGMHVIQQLFGMQHAGAKYLKAIGMSAIQSAKPLRQAVVEAACFGVAMENRPRQARNTGISKFHCT